MKSEEVYSTSQFQEYLESCRSYSELLESNEKIESIEFLIIVQNLLLELYSKAIVFRSIELSSDEDFNIEIQAKNLEKIKLNTGEKIGPNQCYLTIFDPTENVFGNESPVMGDLLDDLIDIYIDIKRQLQILEINTLESRESAIWGLNFDFWTHWGDHAIDAMRTIHYILEKTEKYK